MRMTSSGWENQVIKMRRTKFYLHPAPHSFLFFPVQLSPDQMSSFMIQCSGLSLDKGRQVCLIIDGLLFLVLAGGRSDSDTSMGGVMGTSACG